MSFYRSLVAVVAAMGLTTVAFAADEVTPADNSANNPMELSANKMQTSPDTMQTSENETSKVNINTATVKELIKVKGLNTTKAKAIIAYRKKHGDFKSVDEIKNIHAFQKMNDKTLQAIKIQLVTQQ